MILDICEQSNFLSIILWFKYAIEFIGIVVPLILVLSLGIDLYKIVVANDPNFKKDTKKMISRMIAAVCIFFIPFLARLILSFATSNDFFDNKCWDNANIDTIKHFQNIEEKNKKEEENELKRESEEAAQERNRINEIRERVRRINEEKAKEAQRQKEGGSLNYSNSIEIPSSVLNNAKNSNPSIIIASENGTVLASKNAHLLREGASTTKIFTGYAAIKLLDLQTDYVVGSKFVTNKVGQYNTNKIDPGQKLTVKAAATRAFPGSSNSAAEAIVVAIGKKYGNTNDDAKAHEYGIKKINEFLISNGCKETTLSNGSGLSGSKYYKSNGISKSSVGMTANDLTIITITAMNNSDFLSSYTSNTSKTYSSLASNKSKDGLFFIKSGTGYHCHGVWGFNHGGKRYYITVLGIDCKNSSDDKYKVANDLYNYSKNILIK
ncbi:MAG: hypothetical protein IKQ35_06155 [Bacilli bacterium]|nr:hypothetical protein [Bacilli bacterium]